LTKKYGSKKMVQKKMARQKPLSRFLCGILLPIFLLAACQSTETAPSEQEKRDEIISYCKAYAKKERTRFVKRAKAASTGRDRNLGVKARQLFNRARIQCLEEYGLPPSA